MYLFQNNLKIEIDNHYLNTNKLIGYTIYFEVKLNIKSIPNLKSFIYQFKFYSLVF